MIMCQNVGIPGNKYNTANYTQTQKLLIIQAHEYEWDRMITKLMMTSSRLYVYIKNMMPLLIFLSLSWTFLPYYTKFNIFYVHEKNLNFFTIFFFVKKIILLMLAILRAKCVLKFIHNTKCGFNGWKVCEMIFMAKL